MASIHSIPEHLVGHLYSLLDRESQQAFYASTKIVSEAPSVLYTFSKLTVIKARLYATKRDPARNPLLSLPRKATLRHLVITCTGHEASKAKIPIMAMLSPPRPEQQAEVLSRLHGLEELELQVPRHTSNESVEHAALGRFLSAHTPLLKRLVLPNGCDSSLLHALPPERLEELLIFDIGSAHLAITAGFANLTKLTVKHVDSQTDLAQALSKLTRLKAFALPVFSVEVINALPPSLRMLEMNGVQMDDLSVLTTLLDRIATHSLTALKTIRAFHVRFDMKKHQGNANVREQTCNALTRISQRLAALPLVCIEIEVYDVFDFGYSDQKDTIFWSPCHLFPTIREMSLYGGRLTSQDLDELACLCPHLKRLSLEHCNADYGHLGSLLLSRMTQLSTLEVREPPGRFADAGESLITLGLRAIKESREQKLLISMACINSRNGEITDDEDELVYDLESSWDDAWYGLKWSWEDEDNEHECPDTSRVSFEVGFKFK